MATPTTGTTGAYTLLGTALGDVFNGTHRCAHPGGFIILHNLASAVEMLKVASLIYTVLWVIEQD